MNSDQKLEKKIKDLESKLDNLNKASSLENELKNQEDQKDGQNQNLFDQYSILNKPGLSDITKAYLSSYLEDSPSKVELSDYSKAYLTDYNKDEKEERPALTGLTMEFLKNNEEIEEKEEENN